MLARACLLLVVTSADDSRSPSLECAPPAVAWARVETPDGAARFVPEIPRDHALVSLEHVNLNLPAGAEPNATGFYVGALGFAPDPRAAAVCARTRAAGGGMASLHWMNIGSAAPLAVSRPRRSACAARSASSSPTSTPSPRACARSRAHALARRWRGRGGAVARARVLGPGTDIRAHAPPRARGGGWLGPAPRLDERCGAHAVARPPGGASLASACATSSSSCRAARRRDGRARVCAFYGPPRRARRGRRAVRGRGRAAPGARFRDAVGRDEVGAYDGHHVAVYVNGFAAAQAARARRARLEQPLPAPDVPNLSAALGAEFRVRTIADPETGEALYELEHEVRRSARALPAAVAR